VVRLGRAFAVIETDGLVVRCGAAAVDANVAVAARDADIAGLEFLTGIPGTIGGTLRMNGGAYGREIKDVFVSATAVNRNGDVRKLNADEVGFSYRHTELAEDWIFTGAELKGEAGDSDTIAARIREIRAEREDSQPT